MSSTSNNKKRAIVSICSNNYFSYVRILFTSLQEHHPEADLFLCLADKISADVELGIENVEIIPAADLGIENFPDFAFRYDIMEFNTAVKPFVMRQLIESRGYEQVVYLDPDIKLFASMSPVFEAFENGANFVVTPHLTAPAEAKDFPNDIGIMKAGVYNLGFIALNNSSDVIAFLQWWERRLRFQCINQQNQGIFVDQKFVDLLPAFHDNVAILRDHSLNVAYWNIEQRQLTQTETGWLVDGKPLRFFHFSGIDSKQPQRLSKHTERFNGDLAEPVQNIVNHYLEQLQKFSEQENIKPKYSYGKFSNGLAIANLMRYCYRDLPEKFDANPFDSFYKYLNQPSGVVSGISPWKVTNLMRYLWEQRIDLQRAFDLNHLEGRLNYALWFVQHAAENNVDDYFLQPIIKNVNSGSIKYKLLLFLSKRLGDTTWKLRNFLKTSLWLPRKLRKPLRLLFKSFSS
ncbi:MAG: hypothetical protein AAGA80_13380 [Cyanobacteria bacterium P01_F01_bin.143]